MEEEDRQIYESLSANPSVVDSLSEDEAAELEAAVDRHKARMMAPTGETTATSSASVEPALDTPAPVAGDVAEGPKINPDGFTGAMRSFVGGAYPMVAQKIAGLEGPEPQSLVDAAYREAANDHPLAHMAGSIASPVAKVIKPAQAILGGSKAAGTLASGVAGALYGGAEAAGMGRDVGIEAGIGGAAGVLVPPVVQRAVVEPLVRAKDYLVAKFGAKAAEWAMDAAERVLKGRGSNLDPNVLRELTEPTAYGKKITEMSEYLLKHIGLNPLETAGSRADKSADLIALRRAQHGAALDDLISKEVPVDKLHADVAASANRLRAKSPIANLDINAPEAEIHSSLDEAANAARPFSESVPELATPMSRVRPGYADRIIPPGERPNFPDEVMDPVSRPLPDPVPPEKVLVGPEAQELAPKRADFGWLKPEGPTERVQSTIGPDDLVMPEGPASYSPEVRPVLPVDDTVAVASAVDPHVRGTVNLRDVHNSITKLQSGQYGGSQGLKRPLGEGEINTAINLGRDAIKSNVSRETAASYDEMMFRHSSAERVDASLRAQATRPPDMNSGFATTPGGVATAGAVGVAKRQLDLAVGGAMSLGFKGARAILARKIMNASGTPPVSPHITADAKAQFDRALQMVSQIPTDEGFSSSLYALVSSNPELAGYFAGLLNEKE